MKHLLEHFKTLTKHPQNAEELKGLILQLAIQGKLTENWRQENPNVEPASKLLERIKAEKKVLIAEKKIKKEKALPPIQGDEAQMDIPNSWKTERLGNIGDWGAGATPLRSRHDFYGGSINWFKSGELNNAIIDYESSEKITEKALEKTSVRLNKPGDVLIAMYGATIGKTGRLKVYGTTNQAVCACTPFSCITSEYLHLLLKALKQIFLNQGEGGAQPNISRVKIRHQVFALPPLEEQKAIVAIVNELFKEVEQLEEQTKTSIQLKEDFVTSALQRLSQAENVTQVWQFLQTHFTEFFTEKENVKKLRETILQLAVQGKLTSKWRTCHPELVSGSHHASELLKRIQTEKQQLIAKNKLKKEKALPPIEDNEKPYDLPDGWVWCRLGEAVTYGTKFKAEKTKVENDTWILELEDVEKSTSKLLKKVRFIERQFKSTKSIFHKGDVIYGKLRPYLDKVLIADEDGVCTTEMIPINSHAGCSPEYLRWYLKNPNFISYANDSTHGMNLPRMGTEKAINAIYALPPLEEQKAIVKQVNRLMALCDSLEEHIENSQTQKEQLMQSCLREIFENN